MARAIDRKTMIDLIIEAKRIDPEIGSFAEWLAEYLVERLPTLTPQNDALICDGCLWAEMGALEKCSSCMRYKKDNYYRRPPEGEEDK